MDKNQDNGEETDFPENGDETQYEVKLVYEFQNSRHIDCLNEPEYKKRKLKYLPVFT